MFNKIKRTQNLENSEKETEFKVFSEVLKKIKVLEM